MKRVRSRTDESSTDEAVAEAPAPSERRSGLLSECWADLRGRPRPAPEPAWQDELTTVPETGGVGLDEDGMRRLHTRYGTSTN